MPQLKELFISVAPFNGGDAVRGNIRPIRDAVRWIRDGHMLMVFPAGEVSHFNPAKGEISNPKWNPGIAKIIRKGEAPVLPGTRRIALKKDNEISEKTASNNFTAIIGIRVIPYIRTACDN